MPLSKLSSSDGEHFLLSHYFWHHYLSFLLYKLCITSPPAFYILREKNPFVLIRIFYNLLELLRRNLIAFLCYMKMEEEWIDLRLRKRHGYNSNKELASNLDYVHVFTVCTELSCNLKMCLNLWITLPLSTVVCGSAVHSSLMWDVSVPSQVY